MLPIAILPIAHFGFSVELKIGILPCHRNVCFILATRIPDPHFKAAFNAETQGLVKLYSPGVAFTGKELYPANVGTVQAYLFEENGE
jgi:hypothetical protein